jgi:hypothetical protein
MRRADLDQRSKCRGPAATGCGREWGVVGFVKPPPVVPHPPPDQRLAGAVVRMVQDR